VRFLAAAGLVMVLAGLGAYYATEQRLSAFSVVNLIVGPLLLALAAIGQARSVRGFSGRRSRAEALRWSAILLGALVVVILANWLAVGWRATLDWTVARSYTLAEQTRAICASMAGADGAAPTLLFFEDSRLWKETAPLEGAYREACPALPIRRLDSADAPPEAQPLLARYEATVLACAAGRCELVGFPSEQNITSALVRMSRARTRLAYFLLGHGEVDVGSEGDDGYAGLVGLMQSEGIDLRGWIGPARESVPDDAELVVVAAPERDLLAPELEALDRWLAAGGRMLVLLEPGDATNLDPLLARWGFELPPGVVVDAASSPLLEEPRPVSLLVNAFNPFHPATRSMTRRTMLLAPSARAVFAPHKPQPDDEMAELAFTSARAWIERDLASALADRGIAPDADEPQGSEIPIAAAGRYPRGDAEARIVVIGDRDLASNRLLGALYNRDLVMNAVLWLLEDEEPIALRAKIWTPDHYPIALQETLAYFYFLAFAIPEALLLLGIAAWYRQRG
jgi:hypothetical protein